MTEAEWLTATDPAEMLGFLNTTAIDRKLRLLTVAACHRIQPLMPDASRIARDALELLADGLISRSRYMDAVSAADIASRMCAQVPPSEMTYAAESVFLSDPPTPYSSQYALSTAAIAAGCDAGNRAAEQDYDEVVEMETAIAAREQTRFIRDIFGNPFRPVTFAPEWRTEAAVGIAAKMYDSRDFGNMPVLADALQDAGCEVADILDHCRGPGPHVRGCWVVDLVLGKA